MNDGIFVLNLQNLSGSQTDRMRSKSAAPKGPQLWFQLLWGLLSCSPQRFTAFEPDECVFDLKRGAVEYKPFIRDRLRRTDFCIPYSGLRFDQRPKCRYRFAEDHTARQDG
ncbi:MAG: hypothetical protein Fues2KO_23830 [Fuerstiella sp.]